MSEIDFAEIKRWLEAGRIAEIAKKNDIQPSTAYRYFQKKVKRPHMGFVRDALDEALKNKRMVMEKQKALHEMKLA